MIKIKSKLCAWVLAAGSLAISSVAANAQNTQHAASDLVLTFQNTAGTGSDQTVTVALGNVSTVFRDGGAFSSINIGSTLSSTYGATWYNTTTLWAGAVGFRGDSTTSTQLLNSDPHQTVYVSKARSSVGTQGSANSSLTPVASGLGTAMTSGINSVKNQIEINGGNSKIFVQSTSSSFIDDNNPFVSLGIQSTAYDAIQDGVQGNFGAGNLGSSVLGGTGTIELALDLYRIQTRNDVAGQFGFGEAVNTGAYLGTLTINQSGDVGFSVASAAVPEPSTYAQAAVALAIAAFFIARKRRKANAQ